MYTEKDTVHCVCLATGTQRDLAFQGFEADRNTLKCRCPAAAYGLDCQGHAQCHAAGQVNPGDYGRIVRIDITEQNRRIFVPTPYGSPSWKRGYARRSALERINNRIDNSLNCILIDKDEQHGYSSRSLSFYSISCRDGEIGRHASFRC